MNEDLKVKIKAIFAYICLIAIVLLLLATFPYKEILECNGNNCNVERSYILFNNRSNKHYSFNKTDDIEVTYHHSRRTSYYEIENLSDYNYNIFENSFWGRGTAEKLVEKIKSDDAYIKITKYWIGHKTEE